MAARAFVRWLDQRRDWCFDLLRVYLGVGLLVKGLLFASSEQLLGELMTGWMESSDATSVMVAHYVVVAHLCGGLMLALGLLTRIAALVQLPILIGAVFLVHLQEGLFTRHQNLEFSLLVLFLLVLVFIHGSGRWSVDYYVFQRQQEEHRVAATTREV